MKHVDPVVSVIIVNHNNRTSLMQALESLILNTTGVDYEIIVVDNASQDDSIEMVRSIFPAVKVLALGENCGYAKANNRGVEKSTGRYLLFLNNDTHVPEGKEIRRKAAASRSVQV